MSDASEDINGLFKRGIFPFKCSVSKAKEESEEESEEESNAESEESKGKPEEAEEKFNKMQKPPWVNISDDNYNSLIQDVVNN